jgi:hypothetical protein
VSTARDGLLDQANIDPANLLGEWQNQPRRHFAAELTAAEASVEMSRQKLAVSRKAAELRDIYRRDGLPGHPPTAKVTEAALDAAITNHPDIVRLEDELLMRELRYKVLNAAVAASQHKLTSLKYITTLTVPFRDPDDPGVKRVVGNAAEHAAAAGIN